MEILINNEVPSNVRPGSLWADAYVDCDGKWHAIVGCFDKVGGRIILEHRGNYSTKYHSGLGLEAMWKKYKPQVGERIQHQ